jgi:hypothetical protein
LKNNELNLAKKKQEGNGLRRALKKVFEMRHD